MSEATRARLARVLERAVPDLAEANLCIAAEAYPGLSVDAQMGRVDALADEARMLGGGAGGVVRALRQAGLRGDREEYDDPRNSFLNEVLDRRLGLPIALAALSVAVAGRVGVPFAGVGMPGHYVVADLSGPDPRYLDAFDGWAPLGPEDLARRVRETAGMALRDEHLRPAGARETVVRMLANLEAAYVRRRRPADALWTVELALVCEPGDAAAREREVTLLTALGRYAEAAAAAGRQLEDLAPGAARDRAQAQVDAIEELQWRMN
ncbi:MAG: transglutaminase-like domain-containing protein [Thermoleophilia bacterium]|nr:transglutaminase-like domain-containing protein [Thermoleophilia bacterium]